MRKPVQFKRTCELVRIPQGKTVTVEEGTEGFLVQLRGGQGTVRIPSKLWQVQVPGEDIDVLQSPDGEELDLDLEPATSYDGVPEDMKAAVYDQLEDCYDPEIPVNIVDLGLVYGVDIEEIEKDQYRVEVDMTLTAQGCGMGDHLAADAERKIGALPGVNETTVEIVWDPKWNENMMSEEARQKLGFAG